MNNIVVKTVPNEEIKIRHGFTGADWWWEGDTLQVRVAAELTDWKERAALIVHEVAEALISRDMGITVTQVDDYDAKFEREHPGDGTTNVGDIDDCPYRQPHNYATAIERVLASAMNISWQNYDDRLSQL